MSFPHDHDWYLARNQGPKGPKLVTILAEVGYIFSHFGTPTYIYFLLNPISCDDGTTFGSSGILIGYNLFRHHTTK